VDSRLLALLGVLDPTASVDEIADAVWLARFLPPDPEPAASSRAEPRDVPDRSEFGLRPPPAHPDGTADVPPRSDEGMTGPGAGWDGIGSRGGAGGDVDDAAGPGEVARPAASLHLMPTGVPVAGGVAGRSPAAPALGGTLALARALRPLRRPVRAEDLQSVDEPATAEFVADTGLWIPQPGVGLTHWLDVALVIDCSASMVIWSATAAEIVELLQRQSAFRDVRVWRMDGDSRDDDVLLQPGAAGGGAVARSPRELLDPTGRRLILVFSDCIGPAWESGAVGRALDHWGRAGPVAVLQPLPQRMWDRAGSHSVPARLRSPRPGASNRELSVRPQHIHGDLEHRGIPVPVMELGPRWLRPWAELVAGEVPDWIDGTVLFTGDLGPRSARPDSAEPERSDPMDGPLKALERFKVTVSPTAFRLAALLSAAPLSLPVIRLVQRVLLRDSRPAHLAEVFLSGLLVRVAGQDDELDPEKVEYDFAPGVRDLLLSQLTQPEALRVLRRVSEFVSDRMGSGVDFPALLADPGLAATEPFGKRFASVYSTVLRRLGGNYRILADLLDDRRLSGGSAGTSGANDHSASVGATEAEVDRPVSPIAVPGEESVYSTSAPLVADPSLRGEQPRVWKNVPPRNPNFTGREELLETLRSRLEAPLTAVVPQALHGLGGVGKTQLVVEYVHRYATDYDLVCWIAADDITQVRVTLAELAPELGIAVTSDDVSQVTAAVMDALRRGRPFRRWLMVFDNADWPEALREFFPAATGHILVTSRNQSWLALAASVEVDVFSRPESVDLLCRRGNLGPVEADLLAEDLGDLPLALEQAGAWHRETAQPVEVYRRLLDERSRDILDQRPSGDYPVTVAAVWRVALERLLAESLPSVQLLQLCAFFGPEPIRLRWLETLGSRADVLPSPLSDVVQDEIRLRQAVRRLGDYALGKVDPTRNTLLIHRLVQLVVRDSLDPEAQQAFRRGVHEILSFQNPRKPDDPRTWDQHARLSPHVLPCRAVDGDVHVRNVVLDQVRYRWRFGDDEAARRLGELARDRWLRTLGPDHLQTLLVSRHLGNVLRSLGEIDAAAALNRDTLDRFRRAFGDEHEHTLHTAMNVAADLRLGGDFPAARELDEATLANADRTIAAGDPLHLRIRNNLGVDLRLLGDFQRAREVDEALIVGRRGVLDRNDDENLSSSSSLARDLSGLGLYAEAKGVLRERLERFREEAGETRTAVLEASRTYGVILRKLGEHRQARQLAERTLELHQQRWGSDHPNTLAMMTTFCNDLRTVGDLGRAREVGERALSGYGEVLGVEHPFYFVAAGNVAIALRLAGHLDRARTLDELAVEGLSRILGADHPYTLCAALNLGNDRALSGDHEEARTLSRDTYERSLRVRGPEHPYTLSCAVNLAEDLRALGQAVEARKLAQETVKTLRDVLGPRHPETISAIQGQRAESDVEPPQT
jgi:tetratricopeptide (TPR) repeat protein